MSYPNQKIDEAVERAVVYWAEEYKGDVRRTLRKFLNDVDPGSREPIPMLLWCPSCGGRHIEPPDLGPHKTHACQRCGMLWKPALVDTAGVQFLPGCKDGDL